MGYRLEGASGITCQYNGNGNDALSLDRIQLDMFEIGKNVFSLQANGRQVCHIAKKSNVQQ